MTGRLTWWDVLKLRAYQLRAVYAGWVLRMVRKEVEEIQARIDRAIKEVDDEEALINAIMADEEVDEA